MPRKSLILLNLKICSIKVGTGATRRGAHTLRLPSTPLTRWFGQIDQFLADNETPSTASIAIRGVGKPKRSPSIARQLYGGGRDRQANRLPTGTSLAALRRIEVRNGEAHDRPPPHLYGLAASLEPPPAACYRSALRLPPRPQPQTRSSSTKCHR